MYLNLILVLCLQICGLCSALFLFHEKKPLIFCFKICPLYCPKDFPKKRYDRDADAFIYVDKNPYKQEASAKYHHFTPIYWKSKLTHTTKPPTTTTENPYWDHIPWENGSGDYENHPPGFYEHWDEKPTKKPTTTEAPETTTDAPIYLDHNPYLIHPEEQVYYTPPPHWKIKPITKPTTTTTTESVYVNHPYVEWADYDYPTHHGWRPRPTTTEAPTTTEEPTFICQVCREKCWNKTSY